jgi:hypothetical protein
VSVGTNAVDPSARESPSAATSPVVFFLFM